jgi:Resolvase, N terminal domain
LEKAEGASSWRQRFGRRFSCESRPDGRPTAISIGSAPQAKAYCASRGWEISADYVEPSASATDDRRPKFQRRIDAATVKPPAFDVILVHSLSRFFRD